MDIHLQLFVWTQVFREEKWEATQERMLGKKNSLTLDPAIPEAICTTLKLFGYQGSLYDLFHITK